MDIPNFWRKRGVLSYLLYPLSRLFFCFAERRKSILQRQAAAWRAAQHISAKIIVVGNLTVGGNGKTPVVIALARALQRSGMAVAVISRGYGGEAQAVLEVNATTDAAVCGDEPKLIWQEAACPVVVGKNRCQAVEYVLQHYPQTDWLISDDGLQHYALPRDVEWALIAPDLGLGNGFLLPAGALREPISRLQAVDALLFTGAAQPLEGLKTPQYVLTMRNQDWQTLTGAAVALADVQQADCVALTAIARPERFLARLEELNVPLLAQRCLPDHAPLLPEVVDFAPAEALILMTAKDAVKIGAWPEVLRRRVRILRYEAQLPLDLLAQLERHIK